MRTLFAILLLVAPPLFAQTSDEPIRIGIITSRTGSQSPTGEDVLRGLQVAIDLANQKGGVLGRQLSLVVGDDASELETVRELGEQLIAKDVVAIVGPSGSAQAMTLSNLAEEDSIPALFTVAHNRNLGARQRFSFILPREEIDEPVAMAAHAVEAMELDSIAVVYDATSQYATRHAERFVRSIKRCGATVVSMMEYDSGKTDLRTLLKGIEPEGTRALYISCDPVGAVRIAREARSVGLDLPILGSGAWTTRALVEIDDDLLVGAHVVARVEVEERIELTRTFKTGYVERYGVDPSGAAASGFDAGRVLIDAIRRAGTLDRAAVRESIASTQRLVGLGRSITFDREALAREPMSVLRVESDRFVTVRTLTKDQAEESLEAAMQRRLPPGSRPVMMPVEVRAKDNPND